MGNIIDVINEFILSHHLLVVILLVLFIVVFLYQMCYYLFGMSRVSRHKHSKKNIPANFIEPPISIVMVVDNNLEYIQQHIPLLLAQDYHDFEVVVVANNCDEEVLSLLFEIQQSDGRFKFTTIQDDPLFKHSPKLLYNIGIKAASYKNLLFIDLDCYPVSKKWLSIMSKGFNGGDIVIGYSALERKKGFVNSYMRCTKFMVSMRFLSKAIIGKTYKCSFQNVGLLKNIYFDNKGFTHLKLKTGVDDLFIQKVATKDNVSIILHPSAIVRQKQCGGMSWWRDYRTYNTFSFQYYPAKVRFGIFIELLTRFITFLFGIILIVKSIVDKDYLLLIIVVGLLLIRLTVVLIEVYRCSKRVGDMGMVKFYTIYDFVSPISEFFLSLRRRIYPSKGLWNQ